ESRPEQEQQTGHARRVHVSACELGRTLWGMVKKENACGKARSESGRPACPRTSGSRGTLPGLAPQADREGVGPPALPLAEPCERPGPYLGHGVALARGPLGAAPPPLDPSRR